MIDFQEKPKNPKPMISNPRAALVSMGNYLFTTEALVREIVKDAGKEGAHDFGKSIIAEMHKRTKVAVYDVAINTVPGQGPNEIGYWRDVGISTPTASAKHGSGGGGPEALALQRALAHLHRARVHRRAGQVVFANVEENRIGSATDSIVSEGCIISGGRINRCVLPPNVRINSYAEITDSILFEGVKVGRHARIRNAIVDKNVDIPQASRSATTPRRTRSGSSSAPRASSSSPRACASPARRRTRRRCAPAD